MTGRPAISSSAKSPLLVRWACQFVKFVRLLNSPVNTVAGPTVALSHCRDSADHAALPSRDRPLSVRKVLGNQKRFTRLATHRVGRDTE